MEVALSRATESLTPAAFEARFSDLIELICDTAQAGRAEPLMEAQYALLRAWLHEYFPRVQSHLPMDSLADFERLFFPPTLADILRSDDGALMGCLLRTQSAIETWKNAQS